MKAGSGKAGGTRQARSLETRRLLLDAAVRVIGKKGYAAATVDEIVAEAGVSKGTAFYHFSNKAEMATCVLCEGVDRLGASFEEISRTAPDAPRALLGMVEAFACVAFDNEGFGRFLMTELWREGRDWSGSLRASESRVLGILGAQVERGQREGFFRPDLDPSFTAVALVGMALTSALACADGKDAPFSLEGAGESERKEVFLGRVADLVRHAIATPGAGALAGRG